jgi:hypothetical protein
MTSELSAALASELAGVFGALIDTAVVTTPAEVRPSGHAAGHDQVGQRRPRRRRTVLRRGRRRGGDGLVMGLNETPPEASILDSLREALTQALRPRRSRK